MLAALAETDLTRRVTGDYQRRLRPAQDRHQRRGRQADRDRRAASRQTSRGLKTATGEILSGANDLSERTTKQAATIEETSRRHGAAGPYGHGRTPSGPERPATRPGRPSQTAEEGGEVMAKANQAMERIIRFVRQDLQHHRHDRRHRLPDQSAGPQRLGRSGAGRRSGQGLCRRGHRGPAPGPVGRRGLFRGQGPDRAESARRSRAAPSSSRRRPRSSRRSSRPSRPTPTQMEGIAKDSREQASAIEEVNVAVRQMDEMTQHNAALVEETNAAIEQTEAQAVRTRPHRRRVHARRYRSGGQARPAPGIELRPAPRDGIKGLQDKVARRQVLSVARQFRAQSTRTGTSSDTVRNPVSRAGRGVRHSGHARRRHNYNRSPILYTFT